ncbi:MAG: hypothetical protein QOG71_2931 [Pyrinomonadaceae bacterium]|nr:hypothetical protein [Pyrinomonadaceae bacterium]
MKKLILAHAEDEEDIAKILGEALGSAGYEVVHRGTVLVGESYTQEFEKYIDQHFPVVVCGTIKAVGTNWARRVVIAAQASGAQIFPVKLQAEAAVDNIVIGDIKLVDCSGTNLRRGIEQLIESLRKHYPLEDSTPQSTPEEVLKPACYLDKLTPETQYSKQAVAAYRERLREEVRQKYSKFFSHDSFLERMHLLVGGRLTLTGVLLFTEQPSRYSPMAITKCSSYDGSEISGKNAKKNTDFEGPIQQQIADAYNFILTNIDSREDRVPERPDLQTTYQYPMECVRETIANALCHRDYTIESQAVQVRLFKDRIEVGSPGTWYGKHLSNKSEYLLKDLISESKLRNPTLAQAIFNIKLFEGRGQGIPASVDDCKEVGAPIPEVTEREGYVVVKVFPRADWDTAPRHLSPSHVSTTRLPVTDPALFGRERELKSLDDAWASHDINVFSLVAWGGVGKSALVNRWLERMALDNYRGARRVYAWSFYSQGTTDRAASADQFIEAALKFFGDADSNKGTAWDKGERLARLINRQRTLLVLDGLEPLQHPPGVYDGRIKDPALQSLLNQLATSNKGLCVISTRVAIAELNHFEGKTAQRIYLEHLSPTAGAQLLAAQGVKGTEAELEQAAKDFEGHSLALMLLGSYLGEVYEGDVRRRTEISDLEGDERYGGHAQRMLASYESWFGQGPETAVLRMLGLFNRPADEIAIAALRRAPAIPELTDALQGLSENAWQQVLIRLRRSNLLSAPSCSQPETLDTHPLVREHFGHQLKQNHPAAWREGNSRLFDYLTSTAKELPNTVEDVSPLYAAVTHGCHAGRHKEAFIRVYYNKIQRGQSFFSPNKLGTVSADLTALSCFFTPDWKLSTNKLTGRWRALLLGQAGYRLWMLGRLKEALIPMNAALEADLARNAWKYASLDAGTLGAIYLPLGDLSQALAYSQQGVQFALRSEDEVQTVSALNTRGDVLHHIGSLSDSEKSFQQAEGIKEGIKIKGKHPYSFYHPLSNRYHDLLLSQGEYDKVQNRVEQILESPESENFNLIDEALLHLSLGRAHLFQGVHDAKHFNQAQLYLNKAMVELRRTGRDVHLPRGWLALVELHLLAKEFTQAEANLDEALDIATRGSMTLYQADCHLLYARLYMILGEQGKADQNLKIARKMIGRSGYHLRDADYHLLNARLCLIQNKNERARKSWEKAKETVARIGYHHLDRDISDIEDLLGCAE